MVRDAKCLTTQLNLDQFGPFFHRSGGYQVPQIQWLDHPTRTSTCWRYLKTARTPFSLSWKFSLSSSMLKKKGHKNIQTSGLTSCRGGIALVAWKWSDSHEFDDACIDSRSEANSTSCNKVCPSNLKRCKIHSFLLRGPRKDGMSLHKHRSPLIVTVGTSIFTLYL